MSGDILSGLIGGATFLIFLFLLGQNIIISIAVGVIAFIGGMFLFGSKLKKNQMEFSGLDMDSQLVASVIKEGEERLKKIRQLSFKINDRRTKEKVDKIIDVTERIFDDIKKDPKDAKPAKKFLTYYLDSTVNILEKYIDISSKRLSSPEINATLTKVETILDTIVEAFEKLLEKLLENDIIDLDTEISVLESTIKSEGLR